MSGAYRVGLTGGLASGKSTVARMLAEAGCTVIDADQVVAQLYAPGGAGAAAVRKLFGDDVLDADGAVDRPRLGARVFADADARRRLEAAIHPLVRQRFAEIATEVEGLLVYEATLLVEAGRADEFDLVITVEADPKLRRERAIARGMSAADADARLTAQGDGALRRARADVELRNDGDLDALQQKVTELHQDLLRRSGSTGAAP